MKKRGCLLHHIIIVFTVLVFLALGCRGKGTSQAIADKKSSTVFSVEVTKPVYEKVHHILEAVGSFYPEEEVTVGAEVAGQIKRLFVDEGSYVKKGDLILEVDDEKFRLEVQESEAKLKEATARLHYAQLTLKRMTRLYKEGVIGQQDFDDANTQVSLNQAVVNNIRARLNQFRKSLKDTKVVAPMDGIISERMVSVGEYVKVGADLVKIVDSSPLKLVFTLPEKNVGEIKEGQTVQVSTRVYPKEKFYGKVYFISPKVDTETRTVEVKAWVQNSEYKLKPGFFVNVKVSLGERNSLVLPESAVLVREGNIIVMAVVNGKITFKKVTPGIRYNGKVEILDGISVQDTIVVSGRSELAEGATVEIIPTEA